MEHQESTDNIFERQRQVAAAKTKVGKPPTRLQRHAPASLQVTAPRNYNHFVPSASATDHGSPSVAPIIPLLSPLFTSPPPLPQEAASATDCGFPSAPPVIPLLSPVVLSSPSYPQEADEFRFPMSIGNINDKDGDCGGNNQGHEATKQPAGGEWEHPTAAGAYIEPAFLFTCFQSKCVLVNHAQW